MSSLKAAEISGIEIEGRNYIAKVDGVEIQALDEGVIVKANNERALYPWARIMRVNLYQRGPEQIEAHSVEAP
jgi:hypothetical protein